MICWGFEMLRAKFFYCTSVYANASNAVSSDTRAFPLQSLIQEQQQHPEWGQYAHRMLHEGLFHPPGNGGHDDKAHPPIHPTKYAHALEQRLSYWRTFGPSRLFFRQLLGLLSPSLQLSTPRVSLPSLGNLGSFPKLLRVSGA